MVFVPVSLAESSIVKRSRQPPPRDAFENMTGEEVSTAALISSSKQLCFTSGIILSEGPTPNYVAGGNYITPNTSHQQTSQAQMYHTYPAEQPSTTDVF